MTDFRGRLWEVTVTWTVDIYTWAETAAEARQVVTNNIMRRGEDEPSEVHAKAVDKAPGWGTVDWPVHFDGTEVAGLTAFDAWEAQRLVDEASAGHWGDNGTTW